MSFARNEQNNAMEIRLPRQAKNAVEVQLEKNQYDTETNPVDPRVFGRNTFNLVYGSRFTGKTCLLAYLVKKFFLKRGLFDSILILTPSKYDKAWNNIRHRKRVTILNKCNNALLNDILELQEEAMDNGFKRHVLLIIDDFATQMRSLKALEELAVRGRHANITCICTAQYSRLLSPTIRMNAQGVVLFKMGDKEFENLALEGLRALVDVKDFIVWVKEHTQSPRSFVYINLRNPKRVFNIGFSDSA